MKVLIIGSKGFIGHHLYDYFHQKGDEVWGADVIVDYLNSEHYFLIDASNSDYSSVFQNLTYDLCVNCSGAASVPESLNNPLRDYYLNTVNVFKLLEAIRKYQKECRFINLSSAAVYGNPYNLPVSEDSKPDPLSPYGFHKLQSEQICSEFYTFFRIQTCSLRIFSVYGDGLQKQLYWDLYRKYKSGTYFTLYGTGNESRDFIHVSDLVRAIDLISENSEFKGDVINIGNGEEIRIRDAASIFFSFLDEEINYDFSGEFREGDPVNWRADITKLCSFGYNPSIDIRTGLANYIEWIKTSISD